MGQVCNVKGITHTDNPTEYYHQTLNCTSASWSLWMLDLWISKLLMLFLQLALLQPVRPKSNHCKFKLAGLSHSGMGNREVTQMQTLAWTCTIKGTWSKSRLTFDNMKQQTNPIGESQEERSQRGRKQAGVRSGCYLYCGANWGNKAQVCWVEQDQVNMEGKSKDICWTGGGWQDLESFIKNTEA